MVPVNAAESMRLLSRGLTYKGQVIKLMDVRGLLIPQDVQRTLRRSKAQKIAQTYNEDILGVFDVSHVKNEGDYASDGMHRKAAIEIRLEQKLPTDHMVLSLVKTVNSRAEMAERFVGKNTAAGVTGNDRFKARLVMNGSPEKDINRIVRKHGFELSFLNAGRPSRSETNTWGVRGVAKLLDAYEISPIHFDNALRVLREAYVKNGVPEYEATAGEFICGVVKFLTTQAGAANRFNNGSLNRIIASLKKTSAEHIRKIVRKDDLHSSKRVQKIAEMLAANCNLPIAA